MSEHNWGTDNIALMMWSDLARRELALEWGRHLATLEDRPERTYFTEGAKFVRVQVEELAEQELREGWELRWFSETLMREGSEHIEWDYLARRFRDDYLEENPPHREPMTVWLNRDLEDGTASWDIELDGDFQESLEVPVDEVNGDFDIHSETLRLALVDAGYPMEHRHWTYIDNDFGPIGEWNRPEDEG